MAATSVDNSGNNPPDSENIIDTNGFDYDEEEPNFSDSEDYADDITDEELLGDILEKKPREYTGIDTCIVVDDVPQVGTDRSDKLQNVLRKLFSKYGKVQSEHFPKDEETGKTKGYAFYEYQSALGAAEAVKLAHGYKLDKSHTLSVNLFTDFDRFANVPEEWVAPARQPFKDYGNLNSWLENSFCYDQFSVMYNNNNASCTAIYQNSHGEPTLLQERERWTESYTQWSPLGTYIATIHSKGIAFWGGQNFEQIKRFAHSGVQMIDFSPCERFLITFSPVVEKKDDQQIMVWDVRTGKIKRGFNCEPTVMWPIFKWSFDGSYFARNAGDGFLSIYDTTDFRLIGNKSMKIDGLKDFAWSPTDNIISYWTPEDRDTPAHVNIIRVPEKVSISTRNVYHVAECKMHWQKSGDYLCVKIDRYKTKKEEKNQVKYGGVYHSFDIYRIREKEIPVEKLKIEETIIAFAWEPVGTKFAIIYGESPRITVSFYDINSASGKNISCMGSFEKRQANTIFWSPRGQFVVIAGLRNMNSTLEFIDTSDMSVMTSADHHLVSDVEWDPTGRYIATGVSYWVNKVDNAYWIWNFQGKLLHKQPLNQFCVLLWRPIPSSLLSETEIKKIKKDIKKYYPKFQHEDKMRESKASKEQIERRRKLKSDFETWQIMFMKQFAEELERRLELRNGVNTDVFGEDSDNLEEETIEYIISVESKVLDS